MIGNKLPTKPGEYIAKGAFFGGYEVRLKVVQVNGSLFIPDWNGRKFCGIADSYLTHFTLIEERNKEA
jgi:hypothetical protein